jgi:hypothetical protein
MYVFFVSKCDCNSLGCVVRSRCWVLAVASIASAFGMDLYTRPLKKIPDLVVAGVHGVLLGGFSFLFSTKSYVQQLNVRKWM